MPERVRVRPLTLEYAKRHTAELVGLAHEIDGMDWYDAGDVLAPTGRKDDRFTKFDYSFVAERGDAPVGAAIGYTRNDEQLYLDVLSVLPKDRRRGLGRRLLRCFYVSALEVAPPHITGFTLTTSAEDTNWWVRKLYSDFGFETHAVEPIDGIDHARMRASRATVADAL